jgi:hypothetical protein
MFPVGFRLTGKVPNPALKGYYGVASHCQFGDGTDLDGVDAAVSDAVPPIRILITADPEIPLPPRT